MAWLSINQVVCFSCLSVCLRLGHRVTPNWDARWPGGFTCPHTDSLTHSLTVCLLADVCRSMSGRTHELHGSTDGHAHCLVGCREHGVGQQRRIWHRVCHGFLSRMTTSEAITGCMMYVICTRPTRHDTRTESERTGRPGSRNVKQRGPIVFNRVSVFRATIHSLIHSFIRHIHFQGRSIHVWVYGYVFALWLADVDAGSVFCVF
mmetsp:Transcript_27138/g.67656  ORF Transcript_27138/g.67656 Transcript_27138/m.67656 type:complete len:205 (-) Transcript_27138:185-799(-)